MVRWQVKLEGVQEGTDDDIMLDFSDIKEIMGSQIIERYVIQEISDNVKNYDHYCELPNVKEVSSDKNEKIPRDRTALILATMKENKERFGILLYFTDDMRYEVKGIRPNKIIEELGQNGNKLKDLFLRLTKNPKSFEDVNLILPEDRMRPAMPERCVPFFPYKGGNYRWQRG